WPCSRVLRPSSSWPGGEGTQPPSGRWPGPPWLLSWTPLRLPLLAQAGRSPYAETPVEPQDYTATVLTRPIWRRGFPRRLGLAAQGFTPDLRGSGGPEALSYHADQSSRRTPVPQSVTVVGGG